VRGGFFALVVISLAPPAALASAQSSDPHAAMPERPSVSTHAHTVAPGWVEIEFGFEQARANGRFGDETLPMTLKLGLADRAQLSVGSAAIHPDGLTTGSLLIISSRALGPLSLDLNAGFTRREGDGSRQPKRESLWAAALGGPLASRFGWLAELSGSPATTGPAGRDRTVNSLVGATFNLTASLVVDVAFTTPVSGRALLPFSSAASGT
jgi:hypothetical protein